ncbi:MAG: ATP-binding protein [Chloroflexota bacterium]
MDAYGLNAALEGLCHDFKIHTSLVVTYKGVELPDLATLASLSLYRFAQEALTNVVKHAAATAVHVTLAQELDMISLTIEDNGSGFSIPNLEETVPVNGAGLVGMVERLEMVDGRLDITSTPGQGSRLTAVVPFTREEA